MERDVLQPPDTTSEASISDDGVTGDAIVNPDSPPDPFDPKSLRLTGDALSTLGVRKALMTVPVKKPDKQWFVRVHPDPCFRLETLILEEEREPYLVAPSLRVGLALQAMLKPVILFTAINRTDVVFLWPVTLPGSDGRVLEWHRSLTEAAERAMKRWIRVTANMSLGAYELVEAVGELPEPSWPDHSFRDLIAIAFKDRFIDRLDHPVLQRLRGER